MLRTDDAGLTWTEISSDCDTILAGVDFADEEIGMAVGQDGFILRTDDSGLTWSPLTTASTRDLWDVACIDADHAVAVGEGRSILHTADGGMTWQEVGENHQYDYGQAVYFVDDLSGWFCTFYGFVFHTDDGGLTWEIQHSSYLDLQDIHFTDSRNGISVGGVDGNASLLTDDGGLNWSQQSNPEYSYLNGVVFSDLLTGIAVGTGIFRTVDGAATWQRDFSYSVRLFDVCLMGPGVALAVGRGGAILRAGPDDPTSVFEGLPRAKVAMRAYPNPFNPSTSVRLYIPASSDLELAVYDVQGRRVRSLHTGGISAGWHTLVWDGKDDTGRGQASGMYFMRAINAGEVTVQKMTLVK